MRATDLSILYQLPSNYSLDEIYTIEVVVTGTNARGYGFQAAAQNENGPVGQFLISSESSNLELNNSYMATEFQNNIRVMDF